MIVSKRNIMRSIVFRHNERSIKVIWGEISISFELLDVCAQMKDLNS